MDNRKAPERILYVHGSTMNRGGTEAYMMNYYRHFDRSRLQVDFVVHGFGEGAYDAEIKAMGGRIFHVPVKSQDPVGNLRELRKILSSGEYRVVHAQLDTMNAPVLKIAKDCGVPVRVSHSHNTAVQTSNPLKLLLNELTRRQIPKVATHLFACSEPAGQWLYGGRDFRVIPNAIDLHRFAFDPVKRKEIRAALGLAEDAVVIGHVGRFSRQKNHPFFIPLMKILLERDDRCRLVLVGDGPDQALFRQQARAAGIGHAIRIVEACPNVQEYYNVFDVFCLPSLFEGLGIVGLEAQANGLPCIVSDAVPAALNVCGSLRYLPIGEKDPAVWADNVMKLAAKPRDHRAAEALRAAGYDIFAAAAALQDWYLEIAERSGTE